MTRLASIGPRAIHQPFTKAIYDQLQANLDWDTVAGAALAALTGGNTLNVTSRHHKVTTIGGTIDNIADAAGASEGQLLELYFTGANTIRNNGAGAGNIRSISGQDIAVAAGDVVELVFDGTNWRECARANLNLPSGGQIVWGAAADTILSRGGAGILQLGTTTQPGSLYLFGSAAAANELATFVAAEAQARWAVTADGTMSWGSGGASARDTTVSRASAGIVQIGTTTQSGGLFLIGSAAGANELATFVTTDVQARWAVTADGTISWGPGGSTARDTTLSRSAANTLTMSGTFIQTKSLESAPATVNVGAGGTFTPTHTQGLVQRVNCTGAGTVTIASPGTPTAGTTSMLVLIIHNASGGAVTLSWNAAYNTSSVTGPANGQGTIACWVWNPGTSKWTLFLTSVE